MDDRKVEEKRTETWESSWSWRDFAVGFTVATIILKLLA